VDGGARRGPAFARREGTSLSVAVTPSVRLTPTYAPLPRRSQDVRLLAIPGVEETFVVTLPAGTTLLGAPPEASGSGPFGSYSVSVERRANEVTVKSRLLVRATRIKPADYAAWRRFCGRGGSGVLAPPDRGL
jgi:hypothetical protein